MIAAFLLNLEFCIRSNPLSPVTCHLRPVLSLVTRHLSLLRATGILPVPESGTGTPACGSGMARTGPDAFDRDGHGTSVAAALAQACPNYDSVNWSDVRLGRLLCGKAAPFRCRGLPTSSAPLKTQPSRRRGGEQKHVRWAGKAEPFRKAGGGAP